jgi:predicted nucleic acid-binding protein
MIFVDTWAWIALAVERDQYHNLAGEHHRHLRQMGRRYVTTDFVLSELVTHLYRNQAPGEARAFVNSLLNAADAGTSQLVHVSPQQFRRAWEMRQKYHDKPPSSDATMITRARSGSFTAGSRGRTKPFSTTPTTATGRRRCRRR